MSFIVKCGYSGGIRWTDNTFQSYEEAWKFLNYLRPVENKPSHIILKGFKKRHYLKVIDILYVPQVFYLKPVKGMDNLEELHGGMKYTRKYFCRIFKYRNGGNH